jgi:hypothetical protein
MSKCYSVCYVGNEEVTQLDSNTQPLCVTSQLRFRYSHCQQEISKVLAELQSIICKAASFAWMHFVMYLPDNPPYNTWQ